MQYPQFLDVDDKPAFVVLTYTDAQHKQVATMKTTYEPSYYPPAPMIEIWLASPERAFALDPLSAFIDTGADAGTPA